MQGTTLRSIGPFIKKHFGFHRIKDGFIALDRAIGYKYRKKYTKKVKVVDNQILFYAFQGTYACNPKYISEELERRGADVIIYWALNNPKSMGEFPDNSRVIPVKINSNEYYDAAFSSKVIVTNAILGDKNYLLPVKKNQYLIETWHGALGIKKFDPKSYKSSDSWPKAMTRTGKMTSFCISNSQFEDDVYRDTYWANEKIKILRFGHPRNDILFDKTGEERQKVLSLIIEKYKLEEVEDVHFVLYAPTFRDDHGFEVYNLDFNKMLQAFEEKYGGYWYLLLRYHPTVLLEQKMKNKIKGEKILNVTNFTDIQKLMLIADVGVSDYSSWMFEYMETKKPVFIYASDLAFYKSERCFYYPIESTPFPIATNNNKLIKNIEEFDQYQYEQRVDEFMKEKGCIDDGQASKRTVDFILQLMEDAKMNKGKKRRKK